MYRRLNRTVLDRLGIKKTARGDLGVLSLTVALWGAFLLRYVIPGWDGFWAAFSIVLLFGGSFFSLRLWSPAIVLSLLSQRLLFVVLEQQSAGAAVAELALAFVAAVAWPASRKLLDQRSGQTKREHLLIRENLSEKYSASDNATRPSELDPNEALKRAESAAHSLVMLLKKALACHSAVFCWYDSDARRLVVGSFSSDSSDSVNDAAFSIEDSPLAPMEENPVPLLSRCRGDDCRRLPWYKSEEVASKVQVLMLLPVMMERKLLGAFVLDRIESQPFFKHDISLAERATRILSESAEVSRLLIQANRTISRLSAINEAASEMGRARSFEEVYRVIVSSAIRLSSFRKAVLSHLIEEERCFEIVAVTDKVMAQYLGKKHQAVDGLAGLALKAEGPFPPPNSSFTPGVNHPFGREVGLELDKGDCFLMLPMSVRSKTLAFLFVSGGNQLERSQFEVLRLLCNLGAGALWNAEANLSLKRLATTDVLTVLPNQRAFRARLEEVWSRYERRKESFSLLFLDLDNFKRINDTYGHPVGDEVLKMVANELQQLLRKVDLAARYGGEEFAVILEGTAKDGAMVIAERIRNTVSSMDLGFLNISIKVTVSIGIATVPDDVDSLDKLLETADSALYRAKSLGRNRCCFTDG